MDGGNLRLVDRHGSKQRLVGSQVLFLLLSLMVGCVWEETSYGNVNAISMIDKKGVEREVQKKGLPRLWLSVCPGLCEQLTDQKGVAKRRQAV